MTEPVVHLGPVETARRLGVSVRALRLYERRGLVTPLRTRAGWRVYGPDQIARLHQVMALKSLGAPLARIAQILDGRVASLDAVLALQEDLLEGRRRETDAALAAIRAARARLSAGDAFDLGDLTELARKTTMNEPVQDADWLAHMRPLWRKHLSVAEEAAVFDHDMTQVRAYAADPAGVGEAWRTLIADAHATMAKGDPGSAEAAQIVARWTALTQPVLAGEPASGGLAVNLAEAWREAVSDPAIEPSLPVGKAIWNFLSEAFRLNAVANSKDE